MADPFNNPIPAATSFSVPSTVYDRTNIGATGNIINSANAAIPPSNWWTNGEMKLGYPPVEYFNWFYAFLNNQVNYKRQVGVADWDARQTYNIGDVVRLVNGNTIKYIKSLIDNNLGNEPTNTNYWGDFLIPNKVTNGNYGKQLNVNSRGIVHQSNIASVNVSPNRTTSNGRNFLLVDGWHAYAASSGTSTFVITGDNVNGRSVVIPANNDANVVNRPGFIGKAYNENFTRRAFGPNLTQISCRCRIQVDINTYVDSINYWNITLADTDVPAVDVRNGITATSTSTTFNRVSDVSGLYQFVYFDFNYTIGNYFEFLIKATAGNPLTILGWDLTLTSDNFTTEPIIGSGYDEELTNCLRYYEVIPPYHYLNWSGAITLTTYWLPFTVLKRVVPSYSYGFESYNNTRTLRRNGVNVSVNGGGLWTVGNPEQGIDAYVYADR